jgi:hypothetical protein
VRNPPVSNSVALTLPELQSQVDAGPSTESVLEADASLDVLKFAPGPADGVTTAEAMLRSLGVGNLSRAPELADASRTRLSKPLPSYRLVLPRRSGLALQIPQTTSDFDYIAFVSGQPMALLSVRVDRFGTSQYLNVVSSEIAIPIARALQQLATSAKVQQGAYEPRLLHVTGPRGTPPLRVLWLKSVDGGDDLIYQPTNPDERVARLTRVEFERVYTLAEFLDTARQFVNPPQHDEAWAVRVATECARATGATGSAGTPLRFNLGVAEAGVSARPGDTGVAWFVTFPESPDVHRSHSGAGFLVYESTATCERKDISG